MFLRKLAFALLLLPHSLSLRCLASFLSWRMGLSLNLGGLPFEMISSWNLDETQILFFESNDDGNKTYNSILLLLLLFCR